MIPKFQIGLKSLLCQDFSEPEFYDDLVYKLRKIVGSNNLSAQLIKIVSHYKKIGYKIYVLLQTTSLVVNPMSVGNFAFHFICTPVGKNLDSMMVNPIMVGNFAFLFTCTLVGPNLESMRVLV